ncbi:MAG: hypothetical protein WAV46_01345 [Candidatus Moraniibacteriota bacterium]
MTLEDYIKNIKHGGFKSFLKKASGLGVQIEMIEEEGSPILKLTYKEKAIFCYKRNLPIYKRMGNLTKNKAVTKTILEASGIQTPKGITATSLREALDLVRKKKLRYPLICKPVDGSLAKGVTWDIASPQELRVAVAHAKGAYGKRPRARFLIEEMFVANEYRVLIFNGKVLSCVQKISAGVTGDGVSTIEELISRFNAKRLPGFEIKLDKTAKETLKTRLLSLKSVLPKNHFFKLRNNLNMSDGGRSIDCTKDMHAAFKDICTRAIEAVGLTYGGIDFFAKDISSSASEYVIIEINPNPFYNMHEKPLVEGKGVDVSSEILKGIFPRLDKK